MVIMLKSYLIWEKKLYFARYKDMFSKNGTAITGSQQNQLGKDILGLH